MSRMTQGTLIAGIGILIWSFTAILISHLTGYYQLAPLLLALWRDVLVCLGLLAGSWIFRRRLPRLARGQLPFLMFYGLVLCGFNALWTLSVPLNGAAVATVLGYGSMGFTVLLARWLFQERITLAKIAGVGLSLTGCALVSGALEPGAWQTRPLGMAVGLLTALLFAGYSLAGKEADRRQLDTWDGMFFSFGFASLFLLLINAIFEVTDREAGLLPQLPATGWAWLVVLSWGPTLLGYALYNRSMHYLPVGLVNLIATLEPAFTTLEAYLLLGERMSLVQLGGSLCILAAVVWVRAAEMRAAEKRGAEGIDSAADGVASE